MMSAPVAHTYLEVPLPFAARALAPGVVGVGEVEQKVAGQNFDLYPGLVQQMKVQRLVPGAVTAVPLVVWRKRVGPADKVRLEIYVSEVDGICKVAGQVSQQSVRTRAMRRHNRQIAPARRLSLPLSRHA